VGPVRLGDTPVLAWWSGRAHGDQRGLGHGLTPPPAVPTGLVVHRLRQVHGPTVARIGSAGADPRPGIDPEADALVSASAGCALVLLTAVCAPVALASPAGVFAAVHVGWRGLVAGVLDAALVAMTTPEPGAGAADRTVVAGIGPTIGPCCYEFSPADLDVVAARVGEGVRGTTSRGRPALDLPEAVRMVLGRVGAAVVVDRARCTACGGSYSHRARGDHARQALFVWRDDRR